MPILRITFHRMQFRRIPIHANADSCGKWIVWGMDDGEEGVLGVVEDGKGLDGCGELGMGTREVGEGWG